MRRVWAVLRFAGRWLGPALLLFAVWMHFFVEGAWGKLSGAPAMLGGIVTAIACLFMRAPERQGQRLVFAAAAFAALLFYGWNQWANPHDYREEIVSFDNDGAHLVGTLYLPEKPGKYPGMVLLGGSGATPRTYYRPVAAHFARTGFAVLIYDKRGVGDSTGVREARFFTDVHRNIEQLPGDAAAGLAMLRTRADVQPEAVGFAGISEGGMIAPRAAELNGHAAYILSISGTPESLYRIVEHQGGKPGLADARRWFGKDFDPLPSLRAIDTPSLWVFAGEDTLVRNDAGIRILKALQASGNPIEYRVIPGAWHGLFIGPQKLSLDTMDGWLARVTAGAGK
jgi:uncharacterized protein